MEDLELECKRTTGREIRCVIFVFLWLWIMVFQTEATSGKVNLDRCIGILSCDCPVRISGEEIMGLAAKVSAFLC